MREFELGPSGRFIVWQGVAITNDVPDAPEGPIFLLDRESGESTQLGETALDYTFPRVLTLEPLGLLHYRLGPFQQDSAGRWVRLDTLESYAMPGSVQPLWVIDDTRAVVFSGWGGSTTSFHIFDISTGELTPLFEGRTQSWTVVVGAPTRPRIQILREDGGELIDVLFTGEVRTVARQAALGAG